MSDEYIKTGRVGLDALMEHGWVTTNNDGELTIIMGGNGGRSAHTKIINEFSYDDIKPSDHLISEYKVGVAVLSEETTKIYDGDKYLSIADFFYMWNKDDFHIDRNTLIVKDI